MSDAVETVKGVAGLLASWAGKALLAAGVLILGLTILCSGVYWFTEQRHQANIRLTVTPNDQECPDPAKPLLIVVSNGSGKPIDEFRFSLAAKIKGRSSNVAAFNEYKDDHIIAPGLELLSCVRFPSFTTQFTGHPKELEWSISDKTFRLGG
jgi:hypothetical protein